MKRVLVIDDNIDTLTVVQLILSAEGYEVKSFSNWREGFNFINLFDPELIIMEVHLGTADGRNLAKQLKYQADTKHIPIILFSTTHSVIDNLVECQADEFIAKPFKFNLILSKVRSLIGSAV